MSRNAKHVNAEWTTPDDLSWTLVPIEILMDIRAELRMINATLRCPDFQGIPRTLRGIRRKLPMPRPRQT